MMHLMPRKHMPAILLLTLITVISRFIVRYFYHFDINAVPVLETWHLLDRQLLIDHPWECMWYLHSQPPLFNGLCSLLMNAFPVHYIQVMEALWIILGFVQTILLYLSIYQLTRKRWIGFAVSAYFCITPAFLLYEAWYFYTYLGMIFLSYSLYFLIRFLRTEKFVWGFALFLTLAVICLTISMFHLVWLIAAVVLVLLMCQPHLRKKTILAALFPVLLVTGWYGKNKVMFGHFTASTWMGMNVARIMLPLDRQLPPAITNDTIRRYADIGPFRCLEEYGVQWLPENKQYPGIGALHDWCKGTSESNFNNIQYIYISDQFQKAGMECLKADPKKYLKLTFTANSLYFSPTTNYFNLVKNRSKILGYEYFFNLGYIPIHKDYIFLTNAILVLLYAVSFGLLAWHSLQRWKGVRKRILAWEWQDIAAVYAAFNILYLMLAGNFLELGENNRFRFQVIPLFLFLLVYTVWNQWMRGKPIKQ
ncbi:hypothetical protein [Chitinophaga sp. sic0106]|uniref:hypothetical protein n=1 Tax=Chitinophaga sp. sic0106 TaxID=2854785 RepID=UPI001C44D12A|nr:hypothetical protein [Chitinophaga sp. sic0106]MBV7532020.1 hypothetical protein [Chitinophaga sp. sic0106]